MWPFDKQKELEEKVAVAQQFAAEVERIDYNTQKILEMLKDSEIKVVWKEGYSVFTALAGRMLIDRVGTLTLDGVHLCSSVVDVRKIYHRVNAMWELQVRKEREAQDLERKNKLTELGLKV